MLALDSGSEKDRIESLYSLDIPSGLSLDDSVSLAGRPDKRLFEEPKTVALRGLATVQSGLFSQIQVETGGQNMPFTSSLSIAPYFEIEAVSGPEKSHYTAHQTPDEPYSETVLRPKPMGRVRKTVLALTAALSFQGCAYLNPDYVWRPAGQIDTGTRVEKTHDVQINSVPPGADVFIGGRGYGKTPLTAPLSYQEAIINHIMEGIQVPYVNYGYYRSVQVRPVRQEFRGQPIPQQYEIIFELHGYGRQSQRIVVPLQSGAVAFFEQKK